MGQSTGVTATILLLSPQFDGSCSPKEEAPNASFPDSRGDMVRRLLLAAQPAAAQWFPRNNNCDCAAPTAYITAVEYLRGVCPGGATTCVQPVMQTVYRQVPVTELQPTRQIVKKPIVETKYVDREVTAILSGDEDPRGDVPTVSYQDVTQLTQTQYPTWATGGLNASLINKISPCQYDQSPGFMGWLNRTSLEVTNAFTPNHAYPPICATGLAQTVPVTRRVAINGSGRCITSPTWWPIKLRRKWPSTKNQVV